MISKFRTKMKIITVIGARPQFVKASVVSRAIEASGIAEVVVHTGQHFDYNMSQVFFDQMQIRKPSYNLDIHGLSHGAMTGRMLEAIEKILISEKPQLMLVYGDTNSTLAGALAAQKLGIPIAHVEAGLRSFNLSMPEETNRILTDRISSLLYCPTQVAVNNLKAEGFDNFDCQIQQVGDVMLDAAIYYGTQSAFKSTISSSLNLNKKFVLATVHRQENIDNHANLKGIIDALNIINKTTQVVAPLHPRTKKVIADLNLTPQFTIIDPVGYLDMVELLKRCELVITDSGGLQKEAFFFKKGCVTLREQTEWTELVDGGFNTLAGAKLEQIIDAFKKMENNLASFNVNLYGNGKASNKITQSIKQYLA